jgi:hypothetical protein
MILPMMGALAALAVCGLFVGLAFCFSPILRGLAPYVAIGSVAAAIGALSCSWGSAVALESLFGSTAGGIGFFSGYMLGGLAGAAGSIFVVHRVRPHWGGE